MDEILSFYLKPHYYRQLAQPTHTAQVHSQLCGDVIKADLVVGENHLIADMAYHGQLCAISTAAAEKLAQVLVHNPITQLEKFTLQQLRQLFVQTIPDSRLSCLELPLKAWQQAWANKQSPTD